MALRTLPLVASGIMLMASISCDNHTTATSSASVPLHARAPTMEVSADSVWIVFFNPIVKDVRGEANAIARAAGGTPKAVYEHIRGFAAKLPPSAAEALRHNPRIASVSPNGRVQSHHHTTQSTSSWGLDRVDQLHPGWLDGKYHYAASGAGAHIYVLDTGIRMSHQDFGGRAQFAFDPWNSGRQGADCEDHGTRVASVAGGAVFGVAKGATLWSVPVLDCGGGDNVKVIAGIDWVAGNHASPAVANLSFGVCATSGGVSTGGGGASMPHNGGCPPGTHIGMDDAVRRLVASGVTAVVSAGNDDADACQVSPARVAEAVTVAASGRVPAPYGQYADQRWSGSNWGACVDIFAPGVDIASASSTSDNATLTTSGGSTSLAAPFVAGAVARLLQREPGLAPSQVSSRLKDYHSLAAVQDAKNGPYGYSMLLTYNDLATMGISTPPYDYYQEITFTANLYGNTGGHTYLYAWSYEVCYRDPDGCGPGSGEYIHPPVESNTFSYYFSSERWLNVYVELRAPGGGAAFARASDGIGGW